MAGKLSAILFLAAFFPLVAVRAAELPPIEIEGEGEVNIERFDYGEIREDEKGVVLVAYGGIFVTYGQFKLYCDGVVYWPKERRLYAEGNIRAEGASYKFTADRAYFDFVTGRSLLDSALLRAYDAERDLPIVVYGQTVEEVAPNKFRIRNGYLTTSDFAEPEYRLSIDSGEAEMMEGGGFSWKAEKLKFRLGDRALFYLPELSGSSGVSWMEDQGFPLRSVAAGNTTRDGAYLFTKWSLRIGDRLKLNPRLDYRSERGPGAGLDARYTDEDVFFDETSYYIHDEGVDKDGTEPPPDRGRIKERFRWQMTEDWRLDEEFHYISDRNFLNEYYETEFKEDKDPESYLQIRRLGDHFGIVGLYRYRVNDFQDQTEYLPSAGVHFVGQPLLGNRLYFSAESEVANLRRRSFEGGATPSIDAFRFNNEAELAAPFSLAPISVRPFVRAGATAYSDSPLDESPTRESAAAGVSFSTRFARTFASGLSHHIIPEVTYSDNFHVTTPPGELYQFDEADTLSEGRMVTLRLRNLLYTGGESPREALRLILKTDYFPEPEDFGSERDFSNLRADFWAYPTRKLSIEGDWELNTGNGQSEVAEARVVFTPDRPWKGSVGFRYIEDLAAAIQASWNVPLSDRYSLEAAAEYNFKNNEPIDTRVTITRRLHMWNLEFGFQRDSGEDQTMFFVSLYPLGLF